jgi:hypothetical protein
MKTLVLAAAALVMTVGASATTVLVACTDTSLAAASAPGYATPISCGAFSLLSLPPLSTFVSEQVIVQTDFSGTPPNAFAAVSATYTSTVAGFVTDTQSSSGTGGSSVYSDTASLPTYGGSGAPYYYMLSPASSTPLSAFTINAYDSVTSGSPNYITNNAYEVITYTSAIPEPGTMGILGGGLLALSFVGRKLVRK